MPLRGKNSKIMDIGISSHETPQPMTTEHSHEECEFYFLLAGNCTYLINNEIYRIKKGDLVILPEHTLHRTMYDENEPYRRMLCTLPINLLPHSLYSLISKTQYIYRCGDKFDAVFDILKEIQENYAIDDNLAAEAIKANVARLFVLLLRGNQNMLVKAKKNVFSNKIIDFITENYDKDISLESAARALYVTPSHLLRTFKKETRFTFWEYLLLYRIEKAKEFLRTTNKSIKEISHMCGFNDPNYFSTSFKKHTGHTPRDFRNETAN